MHLVFPKGKRRWSLFSRSQLQLLMHLQDDVLMGTLTVRENLLFSANLRLDPKQHSPEEKNQRVVSIIQDLGLEDCANTKVLTDV